MRLYAGPRYSSSRNALLIALSLGSFLLNAQNVPGNGWSSFGVLPFHGGDFLILKPPTGYILYYTYNLSGRAFSTDLKNWTFGTNICATSGDFCLNGTGVPSGVTPSGVLNLPGGGFRMFFHNPTTADLTSMTSPDGLVWTKEPGIRFSYNPSSVYEASKFTLTFTSFVPLPDGTVRMYYIGAFKPGNPGTPAWYNSVFLRSGSVLSAISKDNGLTWTREAGVRINQIVQGPVSVTTMPDGSAQNNFNGDDVSAIAVTENGRTVYRIFCPSV